MKATKYPFLNPTISEIKKKKKNKGLQSPFNYQLQYIPKYFTIHKPAHALLVHQ